MLQLSSTSISRAYIDSLTQGNPLDEGLTVFRSAVYDIREPEQRREILRVLLGFLGIWMLFSRAMKADTLEISLLPVTFYLLFIALYMGIISLGQCTFPYLA